VKAVTDGVNAQCVCVGGGGMMSVECLLGDYHVLYNGPKIPSDERRGVCIYQSAAIFHFCQENDKAKTKFKSIGRG
jgi:hypothetical protein